MDFKKVRVHTNVNSGRDDYFRDIRMDFEVADVVNLETIGIGIKEMKKNFE